jgi:hypothetical protein
VVAAVHKKQALFKYRRWVRNTNHDPSSFSQSLHHHCNAIGNARVGNARAGFARPTGQFVGGSPITTLGVCCRVQPISCWIVTGPSTHVR